MRPEPVIILSYFFPPCNLTPSERIYSWAKYLKNGNYYPIIITRNWDRPVRNSTTDVFQSSGSEVVVKKYTDYEVHYLPYRANWKDKLFLRTVGGPWYPLYLAAAFVFNFMKYNWLRINPTYSFVAYTRKIIQQFPGCRKMVVTGGPFELFGYAYEISKKEKIFWLADYRDDWTTTDLISKHPFKLFLNKLEQPFEQKWLKRCEAFTTVSSFYNDKISQFIKKPGLVMTNGYLPENYQKSYPLNEEFTITYVGSIYASQPIERFLQAAKTFIIQNPGCRFRVNFIGIKDEAPILQRIINQIGGVESHFHFTSRIPKQEAIEIQSRSHLLLVCAHQNLKGIPGSKLYEYIALKKPVLIFPGDGDIIDNTLRETGQGIQCESEQDFLNLMQDLYPRVMQTGELPQLGINQEAIQNYSRQTQTEKLIQLLDTLGT